MLNMTPHLIKGTPDNFKQIIGIAAQLLSKYPEQYQREKCFWSRERIHEMYHKALENHRGANKPDREQIEKNIANLMTVIAKFNSLRPEMRAHEVPGGNPNKSL